MDELALARWDVLTLYLIGLLSVFFYSAFWLFSVSIIRSRRFGVEELLPRGHPKRARVDAILEKPERFLIELQVGKILSTMALGCVVWALAKHEAHQDWPIFAGGESFFFRFAVLVLFFLIATMVALQLVKALGDVFAEKILIAFAGPLHIMNAGLGWIAMGIHRVVNGVLRGLGVPEVKERPRLTAEEMSEMIEDGSETGAIEEDAKEILTGVIELSDTLVREVMTPRSDIVALRRDDDLEVVRDCFQQEGFSRLLVIGDSLDDVLGYVLAKDLLPFVGTDGGDFQLARLLRAPVFIPGDQPISQALRTLQEVANHFAVVVDDHGGASGIVTMEDLMEEIFGDIFDETDDLDDEDTAEEMSGGELLVDGGMRISDLNDEYALGIPEGGYDTIAGFAIHHLGRIPETGTKFSFESLRFTVEESTANRVTRLRIRRKKPGAQAKKAIAQAG